MNFRVIIPARRGSTRLAHKPLADIAGQPMIWRTVQRARQSTATEVLVATDCPEIHRVVTAAGGAALMTSSKHRSGTDRLAEVADLKNLDDHAILVNLQGDEPLMPPPLIDQVAQALHRNPHCDCATLCTPIRTKGTFFDPAAVKVTRTESAEALYFSRAPIPFPRDQMPQLTTLADDAPLPPGLTAYRHIGLYAYRVALLRRFTAWPPATSERTESLEQLRILAHGGRIHVAQAALPAPAGVDTAEDLERIRRLFTSGQAATAQAANPANQ